MKIFNFLKRIGHSAAACAVIFLVPGISAMAADRQVLPGHVPAVTSKLQSIGRLPGSTSMNLAIGLPLRNQDVLENLLQQIYDPASPNYRHYLTPEQFAENFGPTEQDYQALIAFANSNHLTVTTVHPNRMLLDVTGSATDIENAFQITMLSYRHPTENRIFFASAVDPSVPSGLQVTDISGLNNYALPHPNYHVRSSAATPLNGSGPGGNYIGNDFRAAYAPNVTLTGTGQTVGLLQFDGYFASDIAEYEQLAGLPNVPLANVLLDNFSGTPTGNGGEVEVSLDIEMVASMAPGVSQILVYEAGPFGIPNDILNRMATDDLAHQISSSWSWARGPQTTTDQILKQMKAQGQTYFTASGDSDAFLPGEVDDPGFTFTPISNPDVTAVGGTTLTTTGPAGARVSETVWNWGNRFGPAADGIGSCGGISSFYALPTFQQGINMSSNQGSTTFRNIPDVAMTGDDVYVIADNGVGMPGTGGTSCAAPLWAGFMSLVNQQAANGGNPPIGFLNPAIYAIGKGTNYVNCFNDITNGDDTWSLSPNAFFAVFGYDLASGWGTPTGQGLIDALAPPAAAANLLIFTNFVTGGNGNGMIDFNECNNLELVLTNSGTTNATTVQVSLSTKTPGVILAQKNSTYPNIPAGGSATNFVAFEISTAPTFICGTPVVINVLIKSDQITSARILTLPSGVQVPPVQITNSSAVSIPDNNPAGASSTVTVNNLSSILEDVTVSVNITHPRVTDLTLQLIGPDGTTVTLAQTNGLGGANFGFDCANETTFDDAAATPIAQATAPFLGSFKPVQPLAAFIGKSGNALNGNWKLQVSDGVTNQTGSLNCWTLNLFTATCTNGGGQCPGVDLSIGISAQPNLIIVQNPLTYTISVTNNGPDSASGVAMSQTLPSTVTFVSGSASQGSVVSSGGVVSCSLGNMAAGATATITVVVIPTTPGVIFSTATVGSSVTDIDPSNNSATLGLLVSPALADLALTLTADQNPVPLGGVLTYTATITNRGPITAQNVTLSNLFPANVSIVSASPSQGTSASASGKVITMLGALGKGSNATVVVQIRALVLSPITTTATVGSATTDPIPGNNSITLTTTVTPASDLSLSMSGSPVSVAVGSNVTYTLTVQNLGPSPAANVVVNDTLPANVTFISATNSLGSTNVSGRTVSCTITNLPVNSNATITIVIGTAPLVSQVPITITNSAAVSSASADPNLANNSSSVSTRVDNPRALIVAAGSVLAGEGFSPTNGFIDPGETVTNNFRLQNIGNLNTTNLVATLQATGGVLLTNGPQVLSYGSLLAGGAGVAKPFTFAANVTNGGTLTATLQLQDGVANLGTVRFVYTLPSVTTFTNTNNIIIPDHGEGTPYPSVINVSGVSGLIDKVTVTLTNVNHTYPDDIDMLLVGPAGQSTLLMAHCGGGDLLTNVSMTFDDFAPNPLPTSGQITTGAYKPTQNGSANFPSTNTPAAPYGTNFANSFDGTNANGSWSLYVFDSSPGDQGIIVGGWSLAIATGAPVNDIVDLGVSGSGEPNPVLAGTNLTYIFTVTNNGPNVANAVAFTNALPPGLNLVSANSSQGVCSTNASGAVYCTLTNLAVGANFTVTIVVIPTVPGVVTNIATVTSVDSDLNQANNSAVVLTTVTAPVADLAMGLSVLPNPAVVGGNLNYIVAITNNGPGQALNVIVSAISSPSSIVVSNLAGAATSSVGSLAPGASTSVLFVGIPPVAGVYTNVVTASTASTDPNVTNNSATVVINAVNPAPNLIPAGAKLLNESFTPQDGTIDAGETVTVALGITNAGSAATSSNMFATLLATNGITPLSIPITYGRIAPGDPAKFGTFSFTAGGTNGGVISAILILQDGTTNLGQAIFNFNPPATNTFASTMGSTLNSGPAQPYPSLINISGLTGVVSKVTATLSNLSHTFPRDLEMLLVGPGGQKTVLMATAGGAYAVTNVSLTFDDAASSLLPANSQIVSGTTKPSELALPAPFPGPAPAGPYGSVLGAFNGTNPNGLWALYILDDSTSDSGTLAGWSLNVVTVNPINSAADIAVSLSNPLGQAVAGQNFNYTLNVTNRGPGAATNLVLTETLPANLSFVSTSGGSYSNQPGLLTFNLGTLAAGSNVTFSVTVNASVQGFYNSTATVAADQTDLNPADNSSTVNTSVINVNGANLTGAAVNNGTFNLTVTGIPGQYVLQISTDLVTWASISTNTVPISGTLQLVDPNAGTSSHRYYRVSFIGP